MLHGNNKQHSHHTPLTEEETSLISVFNESTFWWMLHYNITPKTQCDLRMGCGYLIIVDNVCLCFPMSHDYGWYEYDVNDWNDGNDDNDAVDNLIMSI